ncbi:histidine kinase [Niveispirillum sp. KHB5.9]|uniref:sensor histidine kinase n=1 Tax=Niveispirillum sp. KHB5.9 TaxID=3400269 RepID=UPI003A86BC8B
MRNWPDYLPAFTRRLWFQLAVSYTLLAFCAMTLLIVTLYGINDYRDFHKAVTLVNVEQRVAGERLAVAQAIRDPGNAGWRDKAVNSIREKLLNIEHGDGASIYRIANSSRPEVYIRIEDGQGRALLSDPAILPEQVAPLFAARSKMPVDADGAAWLADNGPIWVEMPIQDADGGNMGRLLVLYIAEFDIWIQIRSIVEFLLSAIGAVILLSVPIGIACGLVAARYVTRQLGRMNEVTESWRRGNFQVRIALPNDDVLIRHSQHLNDMAQDLALSLSLKQDLAVTDERNRMARELHDTVKQKLFALGLQLAAARAQPAVMEAAREQMLEAETITREAQHDLMQIITQLRPSGTSDTSLHDRMRIIVDDFRRRFTVTIELNHCGPIQSGNAHTEHQVLRIVQEALMNAVRHGKAAKIVIAGRINGDTTLLTVTDNGVGFDTGRKSDGFGIISMRDRTRDLPRGTFAMESAIGVGTQVRLSWKNGA